MKLSESWLREWVDPDLDTTALGSCLTMAGLEVDAIEPSSALFTGVIVAEILSTAQHPEADKLQICQVRGKDDEVLQVVCGAPNARAGLKAPLAQIGSTLPGDLQISQTTLRGVDSYGMLCAEKELGHSENDGGLWELPDSAPVGVDLRDYLQLDDQIIEVDLTPNRSDCLSIKGIAREVGVICDIDVCVPKIVAIAPVIAETFPVSLKAQGACPRYVGRVIRNLDNTQSSPQWLVEKLRRSGLRSIDPVVDVTNYVMLELGQPMHAFDLATLNNEIVVRIAEPGEVLQLLDGKEQALIAGETLVIADSKGPLAMAGIMGGESSGVTAATKDIFLESAFFNPLFIVGQARKYGLHTDSSHRFERGVDPQLCLQAMERATALLLQITGGEPGPTICTELGEYLPKEIVLSLSKAKLKQQLAVDLGEAVVSDIFERLGFQVLAFDGDAWQVQVPSWRFDIAYEADLVEEIARIHGYNNLPTTTVQGSMDIRPATETALSLGQLKNLLVGRGFHEVITYSFVDPQLQRCLDPDGNYVAVENPISVDMSVMRTSLWPGLIDTLKYNLSRHQSRVCLFEIGLRFLAGEPLEQEMMVAGLIYGDRHSESWNHEKGKVDFYDIKGHVEALVSLGGLVSSYRFEAAKHPALHPGQSAALFKNDELVGYVGALHPSVQKQLGLDLPGYLFELQINPLTEIRVPHFRPLSRYPEVRRDIAVIVDQSVAVEALKSTVCEAAGDCLVDLKIFDVYEGKGIENNRKSIGIGLTFQKQTRTLNETEVSASVEAVIASLQTNYQATLRG